MKTLIRRRVLATCIGLAAAVMLPLGAATWPTMYALACWSPGVTS